jgi:hypothetical protein
VAARYEIRVLGHLSPSFAAALGDPVAVPLPPQTSLCREVTCQAELHELLRQLQELGLELVEVRQLPAPPRPRPTRAGSRRSPRDAASSRSAVA